jgi:Tol biopolymer transport system component
MLRRALVLALTVAATAPGTASASMVYQRGESQYDSPTVVSARSDGSHKRVVAHGFAPTLSPDGRLVAYFTGEGLYVQPVRGGSARRLAQWSWDTGGPIAWSPDSRRLVASPAYGAYLVDLQGRKRELTEMYLFSAASVSPDGRRVVIEKDLECDTCYGDLFDVDVDSLKERPLGSGWSPVWGPRGLAFARHGRVLVRRHPGGGVHTVLHSHRSARPIDWSADGRRLLVAEIVSGSAPSWQFRALLLRVGHGHPAVVPYAFDDVAALSKDGREVLGRNADGEIVRVGIDGSERVLAHRGSRPDWVH